MTKTAKMRRKSFGQKHRPANSFILLVLPSLLLACLPSSDAAKLLARDEVAALREIAKELRKTDWNLSVDPCNVDTSWRSQSIPEMPTYVNQLLCKSTEDDDFYHVSNITLKGQSLAGVLPKSLANLTRLEVIDLTRNCLTGTIPPEWASMSSLSYVSLTVNQLAGPIPKYIGNMTNLSYLSLESNMFSGSVPADLGKLVNLKKLILSANNLTGQLPKALTSLALIDMISSNNFSGKIPDYFRSWPALERLEIQGSGFKGPIPPSLSKLTNLNLLWISDLIGERSDFPKLENMKKMKDLMLRNCNISGPIPIDLAADLPLLETLDLSFNNLESSIPDGLQNLKKLEKVYLTRNFLTGSIPEWMKIIGESIFDFKTSILSLEIFEPCCTGYQTSVYNLKNLHNKIDLSYNNFSKSSVPSSCTNGNLNLFRSSSRNLNSSLAVCLELESFHCSHDRYSLHINCGGNEIKIGKATYVQDNEPGGPAKFIPNNNEWGYSSTGDFLKLESVTEKYIERNDYVLPVTNAELYTEARISPTSLTYYGRCLAKGNYTVTLYFAEIKFTNSKSFYRLGRRIFDVYIQEKLALRDFNIVEAAKGAEKGYYKTFNHISVADTGTIEIRFYYAGKGTTAVPVRGTYGPLISAISVEAEFSPPLDWKRIIKIALGSLASFTFLVIIAYAAFIWRQRQRNKPSREEVLRGIDLQTVLFTYQQIKAATDNFDPANKIGEGGFGSVYKGTLLDGTYIAVKRLSSKSSQGNREFITEIGMISGLHHPNLAKLYGCCVEGSQLFLVYEYMVNNNLARALFDEDWPLRLDWPTRQRICTEIAIGLVFLHEESAIKIVHRDIKPTNVLLDEHLNAKISDFGLARLREEENTHISTRVAGTVGYMSPEYALWGYLTYKADVYSFGVVALEIVAGRSNMDFQPDEDNFCLLDWAVVQQRRGNVMGIIDAKLGTDYNKEEAVRMIKIALLCTNASPALRPTMSQVVRMLQGNLTVQDSAIDSNAYGWMAHLPPQQQMELPEVITETQSLIHSSDAPSKDSSS